MNSNRVVSVVLIVGFVGVLAVPSFAQRPSTQAPTSTEAPADRSKPTGMSTMKTIDCPPEAVTAAPSRVVPGSPQGSGLTAMPSAGSRQQVEGLIKAIDSTRTNRIVEVGEMKLEVEPSTVILVGCKVASVTDLKVGANVKVAYEMKEPNRHLATVIESQN
jgi:hypothetical protein